MFAMRSVPGNRPGTGANSHAVFKKLLVDGLPRFGGNPEAKRFKACRSGRRVGWSRREAQGLVGEPSLRSSSFGLGGALLGAVLGSGSCFPRVPSSVLSRRLQRQ